MPPKRNKAKANGGARAQSPLPKPQAQAAAAVKPTPSPAATAAAATKISSTTNNKNVPQQTQAKAPAAPTAATNNTNNTTTSIPGFDPAKCSRIRAEWRKFLPWLKARQEETERRLADLRRGTSPTAGRSTPTSARSFAKQPMTKSNNRQAPTPAIDPASLAQKEYELKKQLAEDCLDEWMKRVAKLGLDLEDWVDITPEEMAVADNAFTPPDPPLPPVSEPAISLEKRNGKYSMSGSTLVGSPVLVPQGFAESSFPQTQATGSGLKPQAKGKPGEVESLWEANMKKAAASKNGNAKIPPVSSTPSSSSASSSGSASVDSGESLWDLVNKGKVGSAKTTAAASSAPPAPPAPEPTESLWDLQMKGGLGSAKLNGGASSSPSPSTAQPQTQTQNSSVGAGINLAEFQDPQTLWQSKAKAKIEGERAKSATSGWRSNTPTPSSSKFAHKPSASLSSSSGSSSSSGASAGAQEAQSLWEQKMRGLDGAGSGAGSGGVPLARARSNSDSTKDLEDTNKLYEELFGVSSFPRNRFGASKSGSVPFAAAPSSSSSSASSSASSSSASAASTSASSSASASTASFLTANTNKPTRSSPLANSIPVSPSPAPTLASPISRSVSFEDPDFTFDFVDSFVNVNEGAFGASAFGAGPSSSGSSSSSAGSSATTSPTLSLSLTLNTISPVLLELSDTLTSPTSEVVPGHTSSMGSIIDALNPDVPSQKVVEEDIRSFWKMVAESEIELRRGLYAPSSPSASPNATITKPAAVSASQNASAKAKNNKGKGRATTPAPLPPIATTNNGRGGKEMTEEEKAQRRKELIEKYTSSVETKARSVVEAWKAARVDEQARLFELAAAGRNKVQGKQGQQAQGQAQKPSVAGGKATPVSQSAGNANVKRPGIPLSTPAVAVAALNQAQSQARPGTPMGKKQLKNAKAATAQAQGQVKKSEDNSSSTSTSAASSASAGRSTNTNATKSTFGTGPTQMGAARATPSVTSSPSVVPKFKAPAASAASSTPAPVRPGTPTVANVSGAAGFKAWGQVSVGSVNGPGAGVGGAGVPIAKPVPINAAAANATKLSILSSAKRSYKATVSDDIEGQDSASEEEVDSDDDEDDSDDSDDDDEDDEDDEDGEGNGKGVREGGNESPGSDGGPGSMHDIINESLPEIQRVSSPWKWMATSGDAHEHLHSSHGHAHPLAHSHPADRVGGDSSSWGWGRHGPGHVADRFLPGGTSSSSSNLSASPAFVSPSPNNARVNTPRTTSALGNANKSRERASSTARWYPDLSGAALPPFTSSARKPPTATPGMSSSLSMGSEGGEEDPARLMVEAAMQNLNEMAEEGREGDDLMRAVKLFANVAGTQW